MACVIHMHIHIHVLASCLIGAGFSRSTFADVM